jgi:hypothetical protein
MAKKPLKLVCFDIVPEGDKITKRFNFLKDMEEALNATKDVSSNRARELAELAESGEQQLISKFSVSPDGIFCSFLHLKAGAASLITNDLFSKPSFSFSDIKKSNEKDIKGYVKGYTCFLLTNQMFIWKSTRDITISEISLYINWLLKKTLSKYATQNSIISLKQKIKKTFDPLTIKSINIGKDVKIKGESTIETYIKPITQILFDVIKESALKGLDPNAIILDASVILRIKKPRKVDPDEGRWIIQSVLNAVRSDNTVLTDKNGNQIRENSVRESKEIRVTFITDNFLDEAELEQEMRSYLKEL